MFKKIALTILKNKKKSIASGGIIGGTIVSIFMLSFVSFFQIQDLVAKLQASTNKIELHMEQKAGQDVLSKVANEALSPNSSTSAVSGEGELAQEIKTFDFGNANILDQLKKNDIGIIKDANGNFKSLVDLSTGSEITPNDLADPSIFDRINKSLPVADVTLLNDTEDPLAIQYGADFSGFKVADNATPSDINKALYDTIEQGTPASEFNPATSTTNDTTSQATQNQVNVTGEVINTVDEALQKGSSEPAAVAKATSGLSSTVGKGLLISGLLDTVCSVYKTAHNYSNSRLPTIVNSLVRHYALINSLSSAMQLGKASPASISAFTNNVLDQKNGNNKTYTQSAGYQIASGIATNSQTVNIISTSLPVINAGTQLINIISAGGIVNFGCSVLTSPIGLLIQTSLGAVQAITDVASFGSSQALISGGLVSAGFAIKYIVIPAIIRYFTPLGTSGVENGPQWVNNAYMGGVITGDIQAQRLGGLPMKNKSASKIVAEANINQTEKNNRLSISARLFSIHNPFSLVSRIIFYLPNSKNSLLADIGGYFTGLFNNFFTNLSNILMSPKIFAATNTQAPGQSFGITTYGLSDSQISKYDPIQNEQYLYGSDTVISSSNQSLSLKRIQLTGDPFQYMGGKIDTSNSDLYHCFTQSITSTSSSYSLAPVNFTSSSYDPICASEGSLDYNNNPPNPIQESNVLNAYCKTFRATYPGVTIPSCHNQLSTQYHDDIGHFTQYIIDSTTMNSYYSMMSTQ